MNALPDVTAQQLTEQAMATVDRDVVHGHDHIARPDTGATCGAVGKLVSMASVGVTGGMPGPGLGPPKI